MATLNLGRVRLNFKGNFVDLVGQDLEFFDAVTFRGSLYVVTAPSVTVVDNSLNWPPTVVGQQYYKKITQGINFTGQWNSANHYFVNDLATDGDSVYIAQQDISPSNTPPSQSTSGWSKLNGLNLFSVGADDSTLRVINGGESILFKGGQGIDTNSDEEGNITITNSGIVDFAVTGDDNTVRSVSSGQTLQFIGGTLVTTASDANGNITIDASVAFSDLTSTPTTLAGYGITNAYTSAQIDTKISEVTAGKFRFSVAADDSTLVAINSGESINFLGGTLVTTTSDSEGNITIDASVAFSDLTSTPTTLAGYGITDAATSAQGTLASTAIQPGDNISELTNDSNYTTQTYVDNKISDVVVGRFSFGVAADDSTIIDINSGESINFIGGTGITTSSDVEGNITINNDLGSIVINTASNGDVLTYSNGNWINRATGLDPIVAAIALG